MIYNKKGQAAIESLFIIPVFILGSVYLVQALLYFTVEMSIDEAMEEYLLCEVQSNKNCELEFRQNLRHLPAKQNSVHLTKQPPNYSLQLETIALHFFYVKKIRKLHYETQIK